MEIIHLSNNAVFLCVLVRYRVTEVCDVYLWMSFQWFYM